MDFKKTENLEFLKKVLSSGGNDGFLKIENLEIKKKNKFRNSCEKTLSNII